jgi:ATP/maltotriose-dependent transcriptional regulator MalT
MMQSLHITSIKDTRILEAYNLCGKLGVQSRTQAIARARTLNLL